MNASLATVAAAGRFFGRLPLYLHQRTSLAEAQERLAERLASREARLLDRFRYDVFDQPGSIYHSLLKHVGIEFGDVERLLNFDGVDGTLRTLFRAGVYLTVDEVKGRRPIRRGNLEIDSKPELLRSPRAAYHVRGSSGGSRSKGTPILIDLNFVRDCGANCLAMLHARGIDDPVKGDYESPGAGARFRLAKFASFGDRPRAWFSQVDPSSSHHAIEIRINTLAMRASSTLAGRPFPAPVYAPLSDPSPVVKWLSGVVDAGRTPLVFTFPSSAVRIATTARKLGISISGSAMLLSGEPITRARLDTLGAAGVISIPRYGSMETAAIAYACPHASQTDEMHVVADMNALLAPGPDLAHHNLTASLPQSAVFVTALHRRSPFLMINISMGDQADFSTGSCGCPLDALGWTTRIHSVRSFEKLTAGGVTFHGPDVIRILEEALPARFGGDPTDYQLLERESDSGDPILELTVHPKLGDLEESGVVDLFLAELANGPAPASTMAEVWRNAGTVRLVRQEPAASRAGKILHVSRAAR